MSASISRFLLLAILLGLAPLADAQSFSNWIGGLFGTPEAGRQARVDSLFANLPAGQGPIREADRAWFVYSGNATSVDLAGDMSGWNPSMALSQVSGTSFWFREFLCASTARLDYKLVLNDSQWILDPTNPNTISGGFGPNSELAMLDYVQPVEVLDHGYPACTRTTHAGFFSPQLQNSRTIQVVTPPGYPDEGTYPVLIVHDGQDYLSLGSLENILAWMAVERPQTRLPICVCIPPVNRSAEYDGNQQTAFGQFVMDTVIPFINQNYATAPDDPALWGTMGDSSAGDIATYLVGEYPQQFGRAIAMSPYLPAAQYARISQRPIEDFRFWMNWGTYDIATLLPLIASFRSMLEERGVTHQALEYEEGHSWGLWRATVEEGISFCWPRESAVSPEGRSERPGRMELRAWPNPFNGRLRIELGDHPQEAQLQIFNLQGQSVSMGLEQEQAGRWVWEPGELASGTYWLRAASGQQVSSRRILYLK